MHWCKGAEKIGLSNNKLKSTLMCTVRSQCASVPDRQADRQTDRQTDELYDNNATILYNEHITR